MIDELDNLSSLPCCVCATCTCDISQKIDSYEQEVKLSQFLMGLSDTYTGIRGQILLMTPLPTLNQVYSMMLQVESQRDSSNTSQSFTIDNTAMAVKQYILQKSSKSFVKKPPTSTTNKSLETASGCTYYHQDKHTRDKCFFLHCYPPWHRLYGQPKPKLRTASKSGPSTTQVLIAPTPEPAVIPTHKVTEISSFSEAQCQQLTQMIQVGIKNVSPWTTSSGNSHLAGIVTLTPLHFASPITHIDHTSEQQWILDSGATNHITPYLH